MSNEIETKQELTPQIETEIKGDGLLATDDEDERIRREMSRRTRRSFLVGGLAAIAGVAGWKWLTTREPIGEIPWPLRRAHQFNEKLSRAFFSESRLAPTFSRNFARMSRVNGGIGLE